ncbi:MAG: single-stranded-DNA-specific exonuclease RecJ [Candidatus Endonucleobacter bathymodioli]|uniref:Single-stranded-DNA-specific exonuclease RecJ n=1 Tax=Candidatus Endonucleibacter bathymodioli TaxID=539814 RepID=A0AA90SYM8_9GAMM|nr:single-stranded-DNA-specific exonuclease RecJ [Candidatus Endonucleobacter bathymodioli]
MARIYNARGINNEKSLTRKLKELPDYHQLKDIDKASDILSEAITHHQQILIIGDYDCDGATSSALGVLALRKMGANANYLVPNRFEYGYGLTPEIVNVATQYKPDILVTVDNGISSIEGVADAKSRGMKVIVTDHHLAGDSLPDADAIVNPNQPNCPFPGKNTAGVGVIFYVMCALRQRLRENGWFNKHPEPNLASFLDLVALGTVADVVSLDSPNRILVSQGLARIRSDHCRPGIKALAEVSGRDITQLAAPDLGYALGPRLNAAGRLDDISIGIELLMTEHADHAKALATKLNNLNQERKEIEASMQSEAIIELEQLQLNNVTELPWGLCLFKDNWHQGVIGILASRIKEKLHRPVIIFAQVDNGEIKGSARSIPDLHIRDVLDNIAKKHPRLILKFGGHAMAAGLSIKKVDLPLFKKEFNEEVHNQLSEEHLNSEIYTDGELQPEEITLATARHLKEGGPWGHNFSEPSFNGRFQVIEQRLVGKKHLKLLLKTLSSELLIDAIAFNIDPQLWPNLDIKQLDIVYKLDINKYRGKQNLQLMVDYLHTSV